MTDINYTPEEVRLLDLCAASWVGGLAADSNMKGHASEFAAQAYGLAAAMIAERRKRVPAQDVSRFMPGGIVFDAVPHLAPVAQPQPEQAGELTEEAVETWEQNAMDGWDASDGWVDIRKSEIDRAVALMREGLAAKDEADHQMRMREGDSVAWKSHAEALSQRAQQAEKERDEARAEAERLRTWFDAVSGKGLKLDQRTMLMGMSIGEACDKIADAEHFRARAEKSEAALKMWSNAWRREIAPAGLVTKAGGEIDSLVEATKRAVLGLQRAEKAEAALAEAQPVLDAVVTWAHGTHPGWGQAMGILNAYADRRREQAKGAS